MPMSKRWPGLVIDAFGKDPAQFPAMDLDVIGPANADSRIRQAQIAYGLDHGDRRHQGQSRLLIDAQAVGRGIKRDGKGERALVGPPLVFTATTAQCLSVGPDEERKLVEPFKQHAPGQIIGRVNHRASQDRSDERQGGKRGLDMLVWSILRHFTRSSS